jgi:hypothetical protein
MLATVQYAELKSLKIGRIANDLAARRDATVLLPSARWITPPIQALASAIQGVSRFVQGVSQRVGGVPRVLWGVPNPPPGLPRRLWGVHFRDEGVLAAPLDDF